MIVYFNGNYIEGSEVKISPFDRGFQYADGVYEVLRTYNGKYFMYDDHIDRLKRSLYEIKIDGVEEIGKLDKIFDELIKKNNYSVGDAGIYIQITRGECFPRTHYFPKQKIRPTVFIVTTKIVNDPAINKKGIKVILKKDIRWSRCDIKSISLLPSVLASQEAVESNAGESIWVTNGILSEGSHTNFYGVKDGILYTYPLSNFILPGITRKVILEICKEIGIEVREEGINENELKSFNEFFISGTTTEVRPVVQINDWIIVDGMPGSVVKRIQSKFEEITFNY